MIPQLPELAGLQVSLVFVALVTDLLGLLVLGYVLRRRAQGGAVPSQPPTADVVRCPECETENERGYRFCRRCLSELPMSMRFADDGSSTFRTLP